MRHQISEIEYTLIRNRNWWSKIVSGTACVGQKSNRGHDYADETLPETKDCLSNIKTSVIHWVTSAIQNFSRGDSNYQYTPGR